MLNRKVKPIAALIGTAFVASLATANVANAGELFTTAALDAANRSVVAGLIRQAREAGAAIVGIFHDDEVRSAVASRTFDVEHHHPIL